MNEADMLSTKQMALKYGVSPRTLERLRVAGGGPSFIKLGKQVRYPDDSDWVRAQLRNSTSEENAPAGLIAVDRETSDDRARRHYGSRPEYVSRRGRSHD